MAVPETVGDIQRIMTMMLLNQNDGSFTVTTKEIDDFLTKHPIGMVMTMQKDRDLITLTCREVEMDDIIAAVLGQITVE